MADWLRERLPAIGLALSGLVLGILAALLAIGVSPTGIDQRSVSIVAVLIVLVAVSVGLAYWATGGERRLLVIVLIGLGVKVAGTIVRVVVTFDAGDARFYDSMGTQIAGWMADGSYQNGDSRVRGGGVGTRNLAIVVGWLYRILGPNAATAVAVFSFMSFVGSLLVFRAATRSIPELDALRYALLLFLVPSMWFWPSTLGKEAWMVLAIGLATFGTAEAYRRGNPFYAGTALLGVAMAGWIRPHVAALLTLCVVVAFLWPQMRSGGGRAQQLALGFAGLVMMFFVLGQVQRFFGTDGLDLEAVLDETQNRTSEGDSAFSARRATDPIGLLLGIPSVLLRPFPFEAESAAQLATSIEGVGLLALVIQSRRRLRHAFRAFRRNAMVRYSLVYILGFIVAFSVVSNFGILARQRAQLWPILLIPFALQPAFSRKQQSIAPRSRAVHSGP